MWQAVGEGSWVFKGARVPTPKAVGEGAGRVVGRVLVGFTVQYDRDLRWGRHLGRVCWGQLKREVRRQAWGGTQWRQLVLFLQPSPPPLLWILLSVLHLWLLPLSSSLRLEDQPGPRNFLYAPSGLSQSLQLAQIWILPSRASAQRCCWVSPGCTLLETVVEVLSPWC